MLRAVYRTILGNCVQLLISINLCCTYSRTLIVVFTVRHLDCVAIITVRYPCQKRDILDFIPNLASHLTHGYFFRSPVSMQTVHMMDKL